jgi:hypothetical protein
MTATTTQMTASELNSQEYWKLAYIENISLELQNGSIIIVYKKLALVCMHMF